MNFVAGRQEAGGTGKSTLAKEILLSPGLCGVKWRACRCRGSIQRHVCKAIFPVYSILEKGGEGRKGRGWRGPEPDRVRAEDQSLTELPSGIPNNSLDPAIRA